MSKSEGYEVERWGNARIVMWSTPSISGNNPETAMEFALTCQNSLMYLYYVLELIPSDCAKGGKRDGFI